MQQVFLNLLINAEQAIKKKGGAGTITITTGQTSAGDVLISFADTGTGMDASVLPKIFQPFFTTKEPGEGTGLGLALSRSIILDHKGDIRAASTPGEGTAFTVSLPLSADDIPCDSLQS
jgi:signal transduction histidine kinase